MGFDRHLLPKLRWPLAAGFALTLACGNGSGNELAPSLGQRQDAFRIVNGLTTQSLVLNALTANPNAIPTLTGSPLSTSTFTLPYLNLQLQDPDARKTLSYIVGCALDSSQQVAWVDPTTLAVRIDPSTGLPAKWPGDAGLCPGWGSAPPSQDCLEQVSSCVLARNNATGAHVPLSMRGADPAQPGLFIVPASELSAYPTQEGAFYGNIFDLPALNPDVNVYVAQSGEVQGKNVRIPGAIYRNMWACYAPNWNSSTAFADQRLCALPGYNCAATSTGPCAKQCLIQNGNGVGDFEKCQDVYPIVWSWPITTYLH